MPRKGQDKIVLMEEELETLIQFRNYLHRKIERLRHQIKYEKENKTLKEITNVRRDLWIPTVYITPHVIQYLKGSTETALARTAGVSPKTISNIADAETEFTSDPIADAVMQAMGLPHIYSQWEPVKVTHKLRKAVPPDPPVNKYYED